MRAESRFPAMGSDVHVVVVGERPDPLLEAARRRIDELESRWSRFRPDSEVSRLNAAAGSPVLVSADTMTLVRCAMTGTRVTAGRYDPTVLGAVEDAGYDRTFDAIGRTGGGRPSRRWRSAAAAIVVDAAVSTVRLPAGAGFDPGGIGKGLAADLTVLELLQQGADGACVNVGGDLRVGGHSHEGSWTVEVADPFDGSPLALLSLRAGAVATSGRLKRAWDAHDERRHHLIDPRTGRSAATGLAAVTAIAAEAWQAEVAATAAFLEGPGGGLSLLEAEGVACLLVRDDGRTAASAGLDRFLAESVRA